MKDFDLKMLHVGYYIVQNDTFSYADENLSRILGYETPLQLIGKSIWDIIHPDDRKMVKLDTGTIEIPQAFDPCVVRAFKRDETIIWVHIGGIATMHQGLQAHTGHLVDITGLKRITRYFTNYLMNSQSIIDQES